MNLCNWREKLPSSPGDAKITIFKGVPAGTPPSNGNGFICIHEPCLPALPLSITIIKDKGKVRGERKINFKSPNCKHNPEFVNCLETFEGRLEEMKSRTYRNIAVRGKVSALGIKSCLENGPEVQ